MPRPKGSTKTPKLTLHKASGRAVVRIDGKDHYCGAYGTPEAQAEYEKLIAAWILRGKQPEPELESGAATITVSQLIAAFWQHAQGYYRHADGTPTSEVDNIRQAMRPLRRLYGATPVAEFGPLALKCLQLDMAKPKAITDLKTKQPVERPGWCRTNINRAVARIKMMFKWGVGNELIPAQVYHAIVTVPGLRVGRTPARENKRVKPVPDADVDAVLEHVSPQVEAMIELQRVTGMRPAEVVTMRGRDIDTTGKLWVYRPAQHKTMHHEHTREIYLGPRAQEIVKPFLKTDVTAFLFSPIDAEQHRIAKLHAARKTPLSCGNRPGTHRSKLPQRKPRERYSVASYRRAIGRACGKAGVEHWHPHMLRHTAGTRLRKEYGLEAAQVILGHKTLTVTQVYAEKNVAAAQRIMAEVG